VYYLIITPFPSHNLQTTLTPEQEAIVVDL
jgi:hypothetical protein